MAETRKVKSGETLSSIAKERGMSWKDLYDINKDVIGNDPNKLQIGTALRFAMPSAQIEKKITPSVPVTNTSNLTNKQVVNYLEGYLNRPAFKRGGKKGFQFSGQELFESMKKFAGDNPQKQDFVEESLAGILSQIQFEALGGRSPRNNPMNVGEFDEGTKMRFNSPQEGLSAYFDLMWNDYLPGADYKYKNLLGEGKFVNKAGSRYASKPDYEKALSSQRQFILKKHTPPVGDWNWSE